MTAVLIVALSVLVGCAPSIPPNQTDLQCLGDDPSPPEELMLGDGSSPPIQSLFWRPHARAPRGGIIFVSGVDGGLLEPGDGLYSWLAATLSHQSIASVFIRYQDPGNLDASVQDAVRAARHLRSLGVTKMALVGWSFGGAVITQASLQIPEALTIVGLAPQSRDTEAVRHFSRQSILLVHSRDDENVPFESSQQILDEAPSYTRKRLISLDGFDHRLAGARSQVEPLVQNWIKVELGLTQ